MFSKCDKDRLAECFNLALPVILHVRPSILSIIPVDFMSETFRSYNQAIAFLYGRTNLERTSDAKSVRQDLKLERMAQLLESIGNPQLALPAVHIAGTKGKGSTAAMIAEVLSTAAYRVGLFTSPHLSRFEERMTVNGMELSESAFLQLSNRLLPHILELEHRSDDLAPTFFEIATAMAWLYFLEQKVEIVVLEVGLGGRLDATNLCHPLVSVITNIGFDHTKILGNTLEKIAFEKAGIIKSHVSTISGVTESPAKEVIREVASNLDSPLKELGRDFQFEQHLRRQPNDWKQNFECRRMIDVTLAGKEWKQIPISLRGYHQAVNASLAAATLAELLQKGFPVSEENLRAGIAAVRCPARVELVSLDPTIILDSAHNVTSIDALIEAIVNEFAETNRILIFSASKDKDATELLRKLHPHFQTVILTQYRNNPRAIAEEDLARCYREISSDAGIACSNPNEALNTAIDLAGEYELICITGSFYLAAELRKSIMENQFSKLSVRSKTATL